MTKAHDDANRPLLDPDFLTIEDVSMLLRCAVDTVYRIPSDQLPVYRVGKRNLYLRDDVFRYPALARVLERRLTKDLSSREFVGQVSGPVFAYSRLEKVSAWSILQDALTPTRIVLALLAAVVLVFIPFAVFGNGVSSVIFGLLLVLVSVLSVASVVLIAMDRGYDEIGVSYEWGKDNKTGQILLKRRSNSGGDNC